MNSAQNSGKSVLVTVCEERGKLPWFDSLRAESCNLYNSDQVHAIEDNYIPYGKHHSTHLSRFQTKFSKEIALTVARLTRRCDPIHSSGATSPFGASARNRRD